MNIELVDLKAQYARIKPEIDRAIAQVVSDTAFIGGAHVKEFESVYAREYGVARCLGCANGTDAIYIALRMLGVGRGHEVITTAHSWISTSETIGQTGAQPVFVDVDEFYHIDVERIEAAITSRTKAVIPVHLFGQPADMPAMMEIARKYNLRVIEDCAQAHFAEISGQRVGTFGDVGTFSFYPGKNLGAYGDAGCIITNDLPLADKMRMFANHGALVKHDHQIEGINSRLDGLQAAILVAKLAHIHSWTDGRQTVAGWYDEALEGVDGVARPGRRRNCSHVFHLYVVQVDHREQVRDYLLKNGIQTGVHYPTALPFLAAYKHRGYKPAGFPNAYRNQSRILSLPIYPEMTRDQVTYVVATLRECLNKF